MRVFSDFHHSSLYSSLLYTLEGRLGYEVYRQIGERWFKEGFWRINRQRDTIAQYLSTYGYKPDDGTPSLNNSMWEENGIYYSKDPNTNQIHKAITFEKFMEMDFDVVICSIPQHIKPFKELAKKKGAKFVFQEGNNFHLPDSEYPNLMSSTFPRPTECHSIFYHQEFDTNIFKPAKRTKKKTIYSFTNVMKNDPYAYSWFISLENELKEYEFKAFGSQNRDGSLTGIDTIAKTMNQARWALHVKSSGDGFGHVIHNLFACGVPLITVKSFYEGHLAGQMMNDKCCIIIDGMTPKQAADMIRSHEEKNEEMGQEARHQFEEMVDFEKEADDIKSFMENLVAI